MIVLFITLCQCYLSHNALCSNLNPLYLAFVNKIFVRCSSGVFKMEGHHSSLTVCPRHREVYGIGWKSGKVRCSIPSELAGHKSFSAKGDRGINSKESAFVLFSGKTFLPIGTREYMRFSQHQKVNIFSKIEKQCQKMSREEDNRKIDTSEIFRQVSKNYIQ